MKYLLTGGCGFIGSNLARKLIEDGNQVYVVDNLSTGRLSNIPTGAVYMSASIMNFLRHIGKTEFDGIFHLGAPSSSPILRNNRSLIGNTIREFVALMEYAKNTNTKIVYASTSSLYNGCPVPSSEDMWIEPTDFYTEVRYAWERLSRVYNTFYGVKSVGLRLFSVYGQGEESKKRYANLITQMLWAKNKGEVFEIYGDGEQRRDATFVSDVVDAFLLAMRADLSCTVINVGTGKNYSLNQVAKIIEVETKYVPVPFENYVPETLAETTKAEKLLGFRTKMGLEKGIALLRGDM